MIFKKHTDLHSFVTSYTIYIYCERPPQIKLIKSMKNAKQSDRDIYLISTGYYQE